MNYYECIQSSIDYIESNIYDEIPLENAASAACMSVSNFYRMFFAIVGCSVKEYIRLRRISLASSELSESTVLDAAVKYGFSSADSFSRAFRKVTGILPSEFRKQSKVYSFERIDIMDKYFDIQDSSLLEKYPDIKVLREMQPFTAAACRVISKSPENDSFTILKKWFDKNKIDKIMPDYRVFGYDIPNTQTEDGSYGYEVIVTIPDDFEVTGDGIEKIHLDGGLYAVAETTVGEIVGAWQRFIAWLGFSRYEMGSHRCLEEHDIDTGFINRSCTDPEKIKINIFMPICEKSNDEYGETVISPVRVAYYREYGTDSQTTAHKVWNTMLTWAQKVGLDSSKCRIFMYNHGFARVKKFWYEIMITIDDDFVFEDKLVKDKIFNGGRYLTYETNLNGLVQGWQKVCMHAEKEKLGSDKVQWVEEWVLDNFDFPEKKITIFYPLSEYNFDSIKSSRRNLKSPTAFMVEVIPHIACAK